MVRDNVVSHITKPDLKVKSNLPGGRVAAAAGFFIQSSKITAALVVLPSGAAAFTNFLSTAERGTGRNTPLAI